MIPEGNPRCGAPVNYISRRHKYYSAARHIARRLQQPSAWDSRVPIKDARKIIELMPFSSCHFASHFPKKGNNTPATTLWEPRTLYRGRIWQPAKTPTFGRKADSTLRSSQAVPHPSTNRALRRLTSEVRRDPVHSTRYGRQRETCSPCMRRAWCRPHTSQASSVRAPRRKSD